MDPPKGFRVNGRIRRILSHFGFVNPIGSPVNASPLVSIRMGTTVATNALLERRGSKSLLLITKGFKDALQIGNQTRPLLFDLAIHRPDVLYERVIEVDERVTLDVNGPVIGSTGERLTILKIPNIEELTPRLKQAKADGFDSVAICFVHSFTYPHHEQLISTLCRDLGFATVAVSSTIMPMVKMVSRGNSASVDAYLTPSIQSYLTTFFAGFDSNIQKVRVEFMMSDGGLVPVSGFSGSRAILSGPAAGVVGYALTSFELGFDTDRFNGQKSETLTDRFKGNGQKAVIGFDMGGTSTDVSRFNGSFDKVFESTTAGVTLQAPQLDIQTVAAGGGSRLFFRQGIFAVGPESSGANPGPVCYRKNGHLSITDANLVLGRLIVDLFPKIFGRNEDQSLDLESTLESFESLSVEINTFLKSQGNPTKSLDEIAHGFATVANESMCRPIRALTEGKGFQSSDHVLACFGGAGGQHAFAIARQLGIKQVLIHKYAAILSAYGLSLAKVVQEAQEPMATALDPNSLPKLQTKFEELVDQVRVKLLSNGFETDQMTFELYLNLRYSGTDTCMMILKPADCDFKKVFEAQYAREFGFSFPEKSIVVDDIRVVGSASSREIKPTQVYVELSTLKRTQGVPSQISSVYWESLGRVNTPVYLLDKLSIGDEIHGPALVIDKTSTVAVEPYCSVVLTSEHLVGFVHDIQDNETISTALDPILLSVFGHRFMGIAEQMGRTLQKTSVSTNIKERLDFSCALFGPDGGLVANAPHIPVHLGSMQEAVKWQLKNGPTLNPGDVILTNHPASGGSHLPDMTVITPVFNSDVIVFFVASRGHHADIGGIQPGSMPPHSTELSQEGAAIRSFLLVQNGILNVSGITKILLEDPAKVPGCSGTRCLSDNLSDLKAQVAANQKGIGLVQGLISEYTLDVVQAYMGYIQQNAKGAVQSLLKRVAIEKGTRLNAIEYMDDGTPISLTITIDSDQGTAVFDFTGTGYQVYGNTNAPKSVTYSAIIYCLRCLVDMEIPLNQGALNPIEVFIPESCLLNPSESAAVVGGNVMTSQRLCDVILKAFGACAASQGCCNNLTFGTSGSSGSNGFGYYETIGGGSGAGPLWHGVSGVHTHMTNTRMTDVEILERRYPVLVREFGLREGSGGQGRFRGGDGIIRELEFKQELNVSILSERRVFRPYGLQGGQDGQAGLNLLIRKTPNGPLTINLGGKNQTIVYPGDIIRIETPGGGGFGLVDR